jgi:hypothetical protein
VKELEIFTLNSTEKVMDSPNWSLDTATNKYSLGWDLRHVQIITQYDWQNFSHLKPHSTRSRMAFLGQYKLLDACIYFPPRLELPIGPNREPRTISPAKPPTKIRLEPNLRFHSLTPSTPALRLRQKQNPNGTPETPKERGAGWNHIFAGSVLVSEWEQQPL